MPKKSKKVETRTFRAALVHDTGTIMGYAALFNVYSVDLGGFKEMIHPGAFSKSIQEDDVRALINHNPDYVLGRSEAGTLEMSEDDKGLQVEIELPDTTWAADLKESMQRGDVDQMSFQFRVVENQWEDDPDLGQIHHVKKARLLDVSVVTFPAYPQTSAHVRSMYEALTSEDTDQDDQQALVYRPKLNNSRKNLIERI